jgi:hypothetical protein
MGDLLHLVFLGFGKAFAASALVLLARRGAFGVLGSLQARLSSGYAVFRSWLKSKKLYTSMPGFALADRSKGSSKFPDFRMKAADCKVLLRWLAIFTASAYDFEEGQLLATAAFSIAKYKSQTKVDELGTGIHYGVVKYTLYDHVIVTLLV